MRRILLMMAAALTVSACTTPTYESESHYAPERTMVRQAVDRCRVLEWRWVNIYAQPVRSANGAYDPVNSALPGRAAKVGATLGGIGGTVLAGNNSDGDSAAMMVGAIIGSTIGANVGKRMDQKSGANRAIEYSIIDASGTESIVTQPFNAGDRITRSGQTCRLVNSGGIVRVLPAEHLPGAISAPKITRIQ